MDRLCGWYSYNQCPSQGELNKLSCETILDVIDNYHALHNSRIWQQSRQKSLVVDLVN